MKLPGEGSMVLARLLLEIAASIAVMGRITGRMLFDGYILLLLHWLVSEMRLLSLI